MACPVAPSTFLPPNSARPSPGSTSRCGASVGARRNRRLLLARLSLRRCRLPARFVTIGGLPATVPYGAFVQGVGLYQLDVIVPEGLPDGDHDLVATFGGTQVVKVMKLAVKR